MNAHALLSSQGWRGTGHSLHKTDDSIGLAKPLLLDRKTNTKGLGNAKHFTSDLWWMDAFDEQLKGLKQQEDGKLVQTVQSGRLNALDKGTNSKYSLYASFVRGGFLDGTLSLLKDSEDTTSTDSGNSDEKCTAPGKTETSRARKESKEERRMRKDEKRRRKEARALRRAARLEKRLRKETSKKDKSDSGDSSKEEKRLRRARKEEKRRRRETEKKAKSMS